MEDNEQEFPDDPEQSAAASLFGWLANEMARKPSLNEYLSYPKGTWASEEAYVKWKRSNPPGTKPPVAATSPEHSSEG